MKFNYILRIFFINVYHFIDFLFPCIKLISFFTDCGSPYSIAHGSVVTPLGTEYNDSAVYNCDSNFGLVGDDAILCLSSGYWDSPPLCSRGHMV